MTVIAWAALLAGVAAGRASAAADAGLARFLRSYLTEAGGASPTGVRYAAAFADLAGDGEREAIVYVQGEGWCGSGGCTMLVLAPSHGAWRVVGETSVTRTPVRLLETRSHGWRDLGVMVEGGGIQPGYEAALSFNGRRYPDNPSVPPARRLKRASGRVLISDDEPARPLLPSSPATPPNR
jgi:hypothetical protein